MLNYKYTASKDFWKRSSFIHFLRYLIDEKEYSAHGIANVVESPYKWKKDYEIYININYGED